ncbi:MAG: alpha/beta fold hydrolase [Propionibacteriaceae bacterium]
MPRSYDRWYTNWISGGSSAADSPVAPLVDHGRRHHAMALPQPEQFTPTDLAAIQAPTLAVLAGESVAHDPETALAGSAPVPDLTISIEPGASHALHAHLGEELDRRILAFCADHEP